MKPPNPNPPPLPPLDRFSTLIYQTALQVNPTEVQRLRENGTLADRLTELGTKAAEDYQMLAKDGVPDLDAVSEACRMNALVYLGNRDE